MAEYEWTYDDAGRVRTLEFDNQHAADGHQDWTYKYDESGQLTGVLANNNGQQSLEDYSYDANGNGRNRPPARHLDQHCN